MRCAAAVLGFPFILTILAIVLAATPAFSQPPVAIAIASAVATTSSAASVMGSGPREDTETRTSYFESYLNEVSALGRFQAETLDLALSFDAAPRPETSVGLAANSFNRSLNERIVDLLEYDTPVRMGQSDMIFKLYAPGSGKDIVTLKLIF